MLNPRATVDAVRHYGEFQSDEFSDSDILQVIPIAHSIVMFQMKSGWEEAYSPQEVEWAEEILVHAEVNLCISRLYRTKAERQLDVRDEDTFSIGSVSITPGGSQQRIFNKDYQLMADMYEMKAQSYITMVMPLNTKVFFRVGNSN